MRHTHTQAELKKNSNETFVAHAFLRNSNSLKHGSLKKNFQTQCVLNNDQCPRKIVAVNGIQNNKRNELTKERKANGMMTTMNKNKRIRAAHN